MSEIYELTKNVKIYGKDNQVYDKDNKVHLLTLLDSMDKERTIENIEEYIQNLFLKKVIIIKREYNKDGLYLLTITYRNGYQNYEGPTRDYRGESIIYDEINNKIYVGRVSYPIVPDSNQEHIDSKLELYKKDNTSFDGQYIVTSKCDGSLMVISLIKKESPQYSLIKKIIEIQNVNSYYENELGIWCIGSKDCMFIHDKKIIKKFDISIKASYKTRQEFFDKLTKQVIENGNNRYDNISILFESVTSYEYDNLNYDYVVRYEESFCKFLSYVVMNNYEKKQIIYPTDNDKYLNPQVDVKKFDTWNQVLEYKDELYTKLLDGDTTIEPEGFVVWIGNTNTGLKLKYDEYYIIHKPTNPEYIQLYEELKTDKKYEKLRQRFNKLRSRKPLEEILNEHLNKIYEYLSYKFNNLSLSFTDDIKKNKKLWIMCLKDKLINEEILALFGDLIKELRDEEYKNYTKIQDSEIYMCITYFENQSNWLEYAKNKISK